jgi:hypothetical protein
MSVPSFRSLMTRTHKSDLVRLHLDLHKSVEALNRGVVTYARHLSNCRFYRGHDCDCGKDVLVEASTAWIKEHTL